MKGHKNGAKTSPNKLIKWMRFRFFAISYATYKNAKTNVINPATTRNFIIQNLNINDACLV